MGGSDSIIRRKVAAVKAEMAEGGPGADRAWRLALARAARDGLRVALEVVSLTLDRRSLGEVMDLPPERSLIAVLEGPGEALGAIMLAPAVLTGLIEAQTIGRVKAGEVMPRKPTRTDAAMVAGVIDAALTALEVALAEEADLVWAGGFRYASFLDDPRPLGLILEDAPFKVLRAEISLAGGARQGEVLLVLPAEGRGTRPVERPGEMIEEDHGPAFTQGLAERVVGSVCRLDGVLARLTLPLSEVMGLVEGAVLVMPQAGLDRISLEGLDGRRVAEGRLGQNRGMRAIRLNEATQGSGRGGEGGHVQAAEATEAGMLRQAGG